MEVANAPRFPLSGLRGIVWSLIPVVAIPNGFGRHNASKKLANCLRHTMLLCKNCARGNRIFIMPNCWQLFVPRKVFAIHVDSASAIASFRAAHLVSGRALHRHPYPPLCKRIADIPHREHNQIVKIKGHACAAQLNDLECYHALGNAAADRAAEEVCRSCYKHLTDTWLTQANQGREEMRLLTEFYQLSLALQVHRKACETHQPASFNPAEPHPARQASAFSQLMSSWSVPNGWKLDLPCATVNQFFCHSYWGTSLLTVILQWLSLFVWPPEEPHEAPANSRVGISWMELVLSFMLHAKGYIPLHRVASSPVHPFAWARNQAEAAVYSYTWNECATQFAGMVGQVVSLCSTPLLPPHAKRARICSLYRQGAGTCVFGLSHRPAFPNQERVVTVISEEFRRRNKPCSYDWMPQVNFCDVDDPCLFEWQTPTETWNVLQKRLKKGNALARVRHE